MLMNNTVNWLEMFSNNPDQKERLKKAQSANVTPIEIDSISQKGLFKGSGKNPYTATLSTCTCTCGDFIRHKLPCKHMYRLALELGLINLDFDKGINKNSLLEEIYNLSDDTQSILYTMTYLSIYHDVDEFFLFRSNDSEQLLFKGFCISNLNRFAEAADKLSVSNLKQQLFLSSLSDLPKPTSIKKTFIKWINNTDPHILEENFIVLEMSPQVNELKHKIFKNLYKKFDSSTDC